MEVELKKMSFGKALDILKHEKNPNIFMTRPSWYGSVAKPRVFLQLPDENSKMTEPYLYMEKIDMGNSEPEAKIVRFQLDLSCESILADDWVVDSQ